MFWAALAELPPLQILDLLGGMWRPLSLPEEVYFISYLQEENSFFQGKLPSIFRILQPTAMALLSPDAADITLFPQKNAISLPRYSSFSIVVSKLNDLVNNLVL
jgi:hypothetical protein